MDEGQKAISFGLFKQVLQQSQELLDTTNNNLSNEFQWLNEICEAVCTTFTVKSKKLETLPKTPSAKNKRQNRKRKPVEVIAIHEESTPKTTKTASRLKFEDPVEDQVDSKEDLTSGRPVRKCRVSKNVTKAKTAPKQRKGKKTTGELPTSVETHSPEKLLQTQHNDNPAEQMEQAEINKRLSEGVVRSTNGNTPQIKDGGKTEDSSSPSVKTRVRDYENRILTPKNQNTSKTTTPKAAETCAGSNSKHGQRIDHAVIHKSPYPANDTGSRRHGSKRLSKEPFQEGPAPKQTRTRLRLKKPQPNDAAKDAGSHSETQMQKQKSLKNDKTTALSSTSSDCSEESEKKSPKALPNEKSFSDTQVIISEVYELSEDCPEPKLKEYEVVKMKTTPTANVPNLKDCKQLQVQSSPDLIGSDSEMDADSSVSNRDKLPQKEEETLGGMSTRTRTRAKPIVEVGKKAERYKDSGFNEKGNSTFTTESESGSEELLQEGTVRSTRTRARVQKEKVETEEAIAAAEDEPVRSTRTRQRAKEAEATAAEGPDISTAQFLVDDRDEQISGSPAMETRRSPLRGAKRLLEHGRGLSPASKRVRSNIGIELSDAQPLSTSSPIKNLDDSELRDTMPSAMRAHRPYNFSQAQRYPSGFLNRTPVFNNNTSKLHSFVNTPSSAQRQNSTVYSFLKKTSPSPQRGPQGIFILEQKKKRLLEKEKSEKERIRKFEEQKKQELEKKRREREERVKKVEARKNEHEEKMKQLGEQYKKKMGTTAANKAKMQQDREREEAEKRRQRIKKQMEADLRRKQEEEERQRKRLEQEEEARQQEILYLKKRKQEEMLRKQRLAEDKAKNEERLAEIEQKRQEERTKALQLQRQREMLMEQARREKENQMLQERLERERIEKEKKAEKEMKLREEMERLKVMEQERLLLREQELQKQREMAAQERELKQMITNHNKNILTQKQHGVDEAPNGPSRVPSAQGGFLNTTQTLNTTKTLNTTQTLSTTQTLNNSKTVTNSCNSYEITPAKIYVSNSQNDYGLDDRDSGDSTDDEDAPRKKIPDWASGINLSTALIKQCTNPPDLDKLFRFSAITPPDLEKIFRGNAKKRYKQRTSSAIWNTPPMKQY